MVKTDLVTGRVFAAARTLAGLTQAQLVAIGLVIAGGVGLYRGMKLRKA